MLLALILAYIGLILALVLVIILFKATVDLVRASEYNQNLYAILERRYERLLDDHDDLHQEKNKIDKALEAAHMSLELVLMDISEKDLVIETPIQSITDPEQPDLFGADLDG